jgi:outer membrane lipoprotein LolB
MAGGYRSVAGALAIGALLCACAAPPRAPTIPVEPWPQRLEALRSLQDFGFDGRLGASSGSEGFSAGLRWRQQQQRASIQLTGPLGVGAAQIELTPDSLSVHTSKGATLDQAAARTELSTILGFDPPLQSLRYWVLGASDPGAIAAERLDGEQRLVHLEQEGWQVDYGDYMQVQRRWLPRRLTATRGAVRLRLVVNGWRL